MSERTRAISQAVFASAPKLERPRLPDEFEKLLYESDRRRAQAYAALEDASAQLARIADTLDDDEPDTAIPVIVEPEDETSLVTTIAHAQQAYGG